MRKKTVAQLTFSDHHFNEVMKSISPDEEMGKTDAILKDNPEVADPVHSDLTKGRQETGRNGISSEQVLRCAILIKHTQLSYRDFANRLNDSISYRRFTLFFADRIPHFAKLQKMIRHISAGTWLGINDIPVRYAGKKKIENGKSLRTDTPAVESDITYPIDARLLWDSIRVLTRLMVMSPELIPGPDFGFHNRTGKSEKLCFPIVMLKGKNAEKKRRKLYHRLTGTTDEVSEMALRCMDLLDKSSSIEAMPLSEETDHFLTLCAVAMDQCERRFLKGEKVPADEKIVSVSEDHTDIIVRGRSRKPAEFGHKIMIATGKSGIITQFQTPEGNPDDGSTFPDVPDKHREQYGTVPGDVTADRKYFSAGNENAAYTAGVKNVSIKKPGYISGERKTEEKSRTFKKLQRFRSGVEGIISALMRRYGLKRCVWKGWEAFRSCAGLSVVTFNLRKLTTLL